MKIHLFFFFIFKINLIMIRVLDLKLRNTDLKLKKYIIKMVTSQRNKERMQLY